MLTASAGKSNRAHICVYGEMNVKIRAHICAYGEQKFKCRTNMLSLKDVKG